MFFHFPVSHCSCSKWLCSIPLTSPTSFTIILSSPSIEFSSLAASVWHPCYSAPLSSLICLTSLFITPLFILTFSAQSFLCPLVDCSSLSFNTLGICVPLFELPFCLQYPLPISPPLHKTLLQLSSPSPFYSSFLRLEPNYLLSERNHTHTGNGLWEIVQTWGTDRVCSPFGQSPPIISAWHKHTQTHTVYKRRPEMKKRRKAKSTCRFYTQPLTDWFDVPLLKFLMKEHCTFSRATKLIKIVWHKYIS